MRANRSTEDRDNSKQSGVSKSASPSISRGISRGDGALLPKAGDSIGEKYTVVGVLGSGAMGVVYEAMHNRLQHRLAIKVLRPDVGDFENLVARFEREAHASAQLKSVHAARVIDVDTLPNGLPYIVMEYLEGRTLDDELTATGPMPVELAVDVVVQVATAMTEAHGLGIVHRDLKPANLFVCRVDARPVIKVLDFGISKVEGHARLTTGGEWFGTPAYISPEQLRSRADVDGRSDVWSLGAILFELLTGRTPFEGNSIEVISKVLVDPVPSPTEFRPDLSRDLARAIMRALQRDPADRFQTMTEMAEALAPFGPSRSASTVLGEIQRPRGRLGEILVSEGLLSQADLATALEAQRRDGRLLGQVLVEMGFVGHADLLTVIAKQQVLPSSRDPTSLAERDKREREAPTLPAAKPEPTANKRLPRRRSTLAVAAIVAILAAAAVGAALRSHASPPTPPTSGTPR